MSEQTGQKLTEEYRWSYARTNSKGEKIYKHDTKQTAEFVMNYLDSLGIEYELKQGGSMLWIYNNDRAYAYYYTTGRWAPYKRGSMPSVHFSSKGIADFVERFLTKYDKKEEATMPEFPFTSLADKKRYKFIDGKWWYYYPEDGVTGGKKRESAESLNNKYLRKKKKLLNHMYVGGKKVDESHPLFKPGKYPDFTEAAFNSLDNYKVNKEGQLYVMHSPSFPSWCKVGMAVDAEDRVKHFQTSSPYRDYQLVKFYNVQDRRKSEKKAHKILQDKFENRKEWFVASAAQIISILDGHFGVKQFELF